MRLAIGTLINGGFVDPHLASSGERDRSESRLAENESVHFNSYYQGTMRRAVGPCSSRRLSRPASGPFAASIGGYCRFH
jgi:hypothetical protein